MRLIYPHRINPLTIMRTNVENNFAILVFIAVRIAVTATLYLLTSGEEVASDVRFHLAVMNEPLGILSGSADVSIASYPPLQFLVEWPLFHFFAQFTSEFLAFRLMFTTIELAGFLIGLRLLSMLEPPKGVAWVFRWGWALGPHQLLATTVFQQEEVISQMLILLAILLLINKRKTACVITLGAGLIIGKIFFLLPLFYLTIFYRRSLKDIWGWLLVVSVYGLSIVWALQSGGNLPLAGFTPDPTYASHYWVLVVDRYPESLTLWKNTSLLMCVVGQFLTCAVFLHFSRGFTHDIDPLFLIVWPLALFFFTFYQHLPEYLLFCWPAAILLSRSFWAALGVSAILAFAWIPNILFGLKNIGIINSSKSPTRNRVLQPFVDWIGLDFSLLHQLSLVLYSILYLGALMIIFVQGAHLIRKSIAADNHNA